MHVFCIIFEQFSSSTSNIVTIVDSCRSQRLREPLIKSYDSTRKIQKSVILFAFLWISLPFIPTILANVCEKGNAGKTSWSRWERLCGGLSILIARIPGHCSDHSPAMCTVPSTYFTLPCAPFPSTVSASTQNATFELLCCKRVACETRVRIAPMPLTH